MPPQRCYHTAPPIHTPTQEPEGFSVWNIHFLKPKSQNAFMVMEVSFSASPTRDHASDDPLYGIFIS